MTSALRTTRNVWGQLLAGIVHLVIGAGTVRNGTLGTPGIFTAYFMLFACGLMQGLSETGQDAVASKAKDKIGMGVIERELHQFRVGEVAITAQHDAGICIRWQRTDFLSRL